jgi:circadian clock protein KaiC
LSSSSFLNARRHQDPFRQYPPHHVANSIGSNGLSISGPLRSSWRNRSMKTNRKSISAMRGGLPKARTGIHGLDQITEGGLPKGRPTLICGSAGAGKTLLAVQFLVNGATQHQEPGVLMAFDETVEELSQNASSLGFQLENMIASRKLFIDYVHIERGEILETGEYNLEGLFVRIGHAIDSLGAKRVALDSLESLFAGLSNHAILRAELRRLFRWLKEKGVTAVITAERGDGRLTRHGFEEYISDCVILLDHRIQQQIATRRLRIVKYRGSRHGADEYPFLIDEKGFSVLPISSLGLTHVACNERISSGIPRLDAMLGRKGYYRGSSILVSGTAGTGKTSISAHLVDATCRRGGRSLVFLFEESPSQLIRNLRSIGIDLEPWIANGRLHMHATRPTFYGLETHLVEMHKITEEFRPDVVTIDPVTNLAAAGSLTEAKSMLTRLIDHFKTNRITAFFTSLTHGDQKEETTDVGISSLMDTWLMLRDFETNGERNRVLYVLKSRGMAHSNQVREFRLTDRGIDLVDVYIGSSGVLTGSARLTQEALEQSEKLARQEEFLRIRHELDRKGQSLQAQIDALQLDLKATEEDRRQIIKREKVWNDAVVQDRAAMARVRSADPNAAGVRVSTPKQRGVN